MSSKSTRIAKHVHLRTQQVRYMNYITVNGDDSVLSKDISCTKILEAAATSKSHCCA